MKKSILFLQPTFDTNGPRNIRTLNLIPFYQDSHFNITIICFKSFAAPRLIEGTTILRLPLSFLNKYFFQKDVSGFKPIGLVRLISRGVSFLLKKFWFPDNWNIEHKKVLDSIESYNYDYIIASIVPFSNCELALKIRDRCHSGTKVIFDIGDPLSNNSMKNIYFTESQLFNYESKVLNKADYIVVTNLCTKQYYQSMGIDEKYIKVIPQGVNIEKLNLPDISPPINQKIVMMYAGTFYPILRDSGPFVAALNELNSDKIEIRFFGVYNNIGIKCSKTLIEFYDRVNQEELAQHYSKSNVLLYFDNAYGIQTSGKIYELIVLKKTILFIYSNDESPVFKEFKDNKNIIFVKNIKDSIIECLRSLLVIKTVPQFEYDIESYSWRERAKHFISIME